MHQATNKLIKNADISVALAAYKGEQYILEQLESIARQTVLPREVVVTDDSPDDLTGDVVARFAETAPFEVRYEKNVERLGYRGNFFKAIGLCRGDVVAFCDQDDVWTDDKLAVMAPLFDDPKVMVAMHNVEVVNQALAPLPAANAKHWAYEGTYEAMQPDPWYLLFGMCALVRRVVFTVFDVTERPLDHTWPTETMSHDEWAWAMGTALGRLVAVPQKLALYRQHESNTVGAPASRNRRENMKRALAAGHAQYLLMATCSAQRATVFESVTLPELRDNARRAADYYRRLSAGLTRRAAVYSAAAPRWRRLVNVGAMVLTRGYRSKQQAGLGGKAFLKDMYVCLFTANQTAKS
jgi:glycosyltransferase involved in cell wall biosynthesis